MSKFAFLLLAVMIASCSKKETYEKTVIENQTDNVLDKKKIDMIISSWYLDQYSAIEELERITDSKIEFGSKLDDAPVSVLNKQKNVVTKYLDHSDLGDKFKTWSDMQEVTAKDLFSSVNGEISPLPRELTPLEKGMFFIEEQKNLMMSLSK